MSITPSDLQAVGITSPEVGEWPELTGLTADSRQVQPGDIFFALPGSTPGSNQDGTAYIPQALERGAGAVVVADSQANAVENDEALICRAAQPRRAYALLASRLTPGRPGYCAAVTGTNGKTSIVTLCRQLWQLAGKQAASLGTMGIQSEQYTVPGTLTTPDAVQLHSALETLAQNGVTHLALEASSHGLDQHRLDGLSVDCAVFTHLSHDHLDYHKTPEAYFHAKRLLFSNILKKRGVAVLNADAEHYKELASLAASRQDQVIDYGLEAKHLQLLSVTPQAHGITMRVLYKGIDYSIDVPLFGLFQAHNLLAAIGVMLASGINFDHLLPLIADLTVIPGRLERVSTVRSPFTVFIDYAHTPDALEKALLALRPHCQERLHVVFGCGGNRDKAKRPVMGEVAQRLADTVIVTDDNPRHEDPDSIREEILTACPDAVNIADRAEAVAFAIRHAKKGDCVLIAGKGHETGQYVAGEVIPYSDYQAVTQAL